MGNEHEVMPYRIVAARDGTLLDYDPAVPAGAPTVMNAGEVVTFRAGTGDAFVVRTQDAEHPIYLAAYMTGSNGDGRTAKSYGGRGDPEFVNVVAAGQYLSSYSFYADPTYPETSLVVVRAKSRGEFEDVWLECAGNLPEWKPVGTRGDYEYTRVDLARQGGPGDSFGTSVCRNGLQRMKSEGPFTATLWGWGAAASYAYPGGMAQRKLVETPLTLTR
jgi:IgGFc binding protein